MTQSPDSTLETQMVGRVLDGRWKVGELVGSGAFGSVFHATHGTLGTPAAVKVLHTDISDAAVAARFEREARTTARLRHPNCVGVLDFGDDLGRPYLVMEYLEGPTLGEVIGAADALPVTRIVAIMTQVGAALAAAHEHGVVHRDIKPDNIVLLDVAGRGARREQVKVCDFGVASVDEAGAARLTKVGQLVGTPAFMAPEQGLSQSVDGRADIYAVGVTLYLMVTGQLPFGYTNSIAMVRAHIMETPRRPSDRVPGLPAALEACILRCLEKNPDDRYPDADALCVALEALLDDPASREWVVGRDVLATVPGTLSSSGRLYRPTHRDVHADGYAATEIMDGHPLAVGRDDGDTVPVRPPAPRTVLADPTAALHHDRETLHLPPNHGANPFATRRTEPRVGRTLVVAAALALLAAVGLLAWLILAS